MTDRPTPTAVAAKAFMERIDNDTYQQIIRTRAILGGWVGSRSMGCYDTRLSDAITDAALSAVMNLFRAWAAECDEADLAAKLAVNPGYQAALADAESETFDGPGVSGAEMIKAADERRRQARA